MELKLINVAVSDFKVGDKNDLLRTVGLGSCVAVCLYDKQNLIGGLGHILLPDNTNDTSTPAKYANTAIPLLIKTMIEHGANPKNLTAKLAGGAQMFAFANTNIGKSNAKKVKEVLNDLNIDIIAEELGGNFGRAIDFFVHDGSVIIKSVGQQDRFM